MKKKEQTTLTLQASDEYLEHWNLKPKSPTKEEKTKGSITQSPQQRKEEENTHLEQRKTIRKRYKEEKKKHKATHESNAKPNKQKQSKRSTGNTTKTRTTKNYHHP